MLKTLLKRFALNRHPSWSVEQVQDMISAGQLEEAQRSVQYLIEATPDRAHQQKALLGHIKFLEHRDEEAETDFRSILEETPGHAYAHFGLSLIFVEKGNHAQALEHAQFAVNVDSENAHLLSQLGYCYILVNGFPSAENYIRQALKRKPNNKICWNNLGLILLAKGDPGGAKYCWHQALEIDPQFQKATENMQRLDAELQNSNITFTTEEKENICSTTPEEREDTSASAIPWTEINSLLQAKRFDQALNLAENHWPNDPTADDYQRMSQMYRQANDHQTSLETLIDWTAADPDNALAWEALGEGYLSSDLHIKSIEPFEKAIELGIASAKTHVNLSHALFAVERYTDSADQMAIACQLDRSVQHMKQLASSLVMCCRYQEALDIYQRLMHEELIFENEIGANYALCLTYMGRFDDALPLLDNAISNHRNDPSILLMRATIHLLHQRWELGWKDYLWRGTSIKNHLRTLPFDKWNGHDLKGKTIVLLAEQGLGDQIMFASCIPDILAMQPKRVVLESSNRVAKVLARSFESCEVIASKQSTDLSWASGLQNVDCFAPLGDLPFHFRQHTHDFPGTPYLVPAKERVTHWQEWLQSHGGGPYIGFSWKGGSELTRTAIRTADCASFTRLMRNIPGTWVCLQYGDVAHDVEQMRAAGQTIAYAAESIADLDEFAALIKALDQVVTVCNTTVHFAGALGVPTLVLAPQIPEWRYGMSVDTMPWYGSAKVLRQEKPDDWEDLFKRVEGVLKSQFWGVQAPD